MLTEFTRVAKDTHRVYKESINSFQTIKVSETMARLDGHTEALKQALPLLLSTVEEQQKAARATHDLYNQSLEISQLSRKTNLIRQLRLGTRKLPGKDGTLYSLPLMFEKRPDLLSTILLDFLDQKTNDFYEFLLVSVNHKIYGEPLKKLVGLLAEQECR